VWRREPRCAGSACGLQPPSLYDQPQHLLSANLVNSTVVAGDDPQVALARGIRETAL
jgi:hypothetical protein